MGGGQTGMGMSSFLGGLNDLPISEDSIGMVLMVLIMESSCVSLWFGEIVIVSE